MTQLPFRRRPILLVGILAIAFARPLLIGVHAKELAESRANSALTPVPKLENDSYDWYARHAAVMKIKDKIDPQIVMIGDSITHFWSGPPEARLQNGPHSWKACFGKYRVLNLGYGWDRTQNVLWRLDHGEFDGLHPAYVIINIGTNNLTATANAKENTPAQIVEAVQTICNRVHSKAPESQIIVMGVFPRGEKADNPFRPKIAELNRRLAVLGEMPKVAFLDIGEKFLTPKGDIPKSLMNDYCHPTEQGYRIWAEALKPYLKDVAAE